MRICIHTRTSLPIDPVILLDIVKALVNVYSTHPQYEIVIVGLALPASFTSFCNEIEQVSILTPNDALVLYKETKNSIIIHFGTTIKGAHQIPQLFIPLALSNRLDHSFIQSYFLKKRFHQWMKKASKVICINDWAFAHLKDQYPQYHLALQRVYLPSLAVPAFEWQELSKAQENLTQGHNYFLCFAPLKRFTAILKEFSIFKKWQQTTMHLVFVFDHPKDKEAALLQLKGYKFNQDINIVCTHDICMEWLAATYAILWEDVAFTKSSWMYYAIEYEVPLLLDTAMNLPETWLPAGEVFSFTEEQALSNHFKLYYKDEIYRQTRARMATEWLLKLKEEHAHLSMLDITPIQ